MVWYLLYLQTIIASLVMRRKQIQHKNFIVTLHDNARTPEWGWNKSVKIIKDSLEVMENFLYSKETLLKKSQQDKVEVDVHFCGDTKMKRINGEFRSKNKTTDVLSFPVYESLRVDSDEFVFPGPVHIGDIIISRDVAIKQAKEFKLKVEQEVIHLLIHGFLHLQGWDHEISQKEEEIMEAHEKKLLSKIKSLRDKKVK